MQGSGDPLGLALGQLDWDVCGTWDFPAQLYLAPVKGRGTGGRGLRGE